MNLFEVQAKIGLDSSEYYRGLNKAESRIKTLGSGIKRGIGAAAVATTAAIGTATTAIGVLVKKSVDGYAETQQLVGGVQKLYGNMGMSLEEYAENQGKSIDAVRAEWQKLDEAQNMVLDNAKNAFKTTGMSANQYMSIATTFSASLIKSLGGDTVAAAEKTDVAMKAIADNYNTFGGDMSMIQNAFMGFAKQNYTMLDNLKLGYGGTKSEMVELIRDSGILGKKADELTAKNLDEMVTFADIVDAIQVIQEKQQIAGTTAREAASTIEGSMNMVKAAWQNLVAGFSDPDADIAKLVKDFTTSASTVVKNIVPTIGQAIKGLSQALNEIIPEVVRGLPYFFSEIAIPLLNAGAEAVRLAVKGIIELLPQIFADSGFEEKFDWILGKIDEYVPMVVEKATELLVKFSEFIRDHGEDIVMAGMNIIYHIVNGIAQALPDFIAALPQIIANLAIFLVNSAPKIWVIGQKITFALAKGLILGILKLPEACARLAKSIFDYFGEKDWQPIGKNIMLGIANGIINFAFWPIKAMSNVAKKIYDTAASYLQINSPSKLFRDKIGGGIAEGMAKGITDNIPVVTQAMNELDNRIVSPYIGEDYIGASDDGVEDYESTAWDVLNTPVAAETAAGGKDITVVLQLDKTQLGRTVFTLNKEQEQIKGVSLAGGYA